MQLHHRGARFGLDSGSKKKLVLLERIQEGSRSPVFHASVDDEPAVCKLMRKNELETLRAAQGAGVVRLIYITDDLAAAKGPGAAQLQAAYAIYGGMLPASSLVAMEKLGVAQFHPRLHVDSPPIDTEPGLDRHVQAGATYRVINPGHLRLRYLHELLDVIVALNSKGIVHWDVKQENLGVDHEGHLRIYDFGFARRIDNESRYKDILAYGKLLYNTLVRFYAFAPGRHYESYSNPLSKAQLQSTVTFLTGASSAVLSAMRECFSLDKSSSSDDVARIVRLLYAALRELHAASRQKDNKQQLDMMSTAWVKQDTCRFCDHRARKKRASDEEESRIKGRERAVFTDKIFDEMCVCADNTLGLGKYVHDDKSDSYTDRFVAEGGPDDDESVQFAREIFKGLIKEALHGDTFKTTSFPRIRAAADALAPFLDEEQKQRVSETIVTTEDAFSKYVKFVLYMNVSPDLNRERLSTPYAWFKATEWCIENLLTADLSVASALTKALKEGVKCDESCSSPCKMAHGKCSYEPHPLLQATTRPVEIKGCGLSALTRGMQPKKVERKDEDVVFEQEMRLCEDSARRRSKAYTNGTPIVADNDEGKMRPGDIMVGSPLRVQDTCAFCRELRDLGVISTGNFYTMCSKAVCGEQTHAPIIVSAAESALEPKIKFARGIFMEFIKSTLIWNPERTGVSRSTFRTANFHAMRVAINKASFYMDKGDISKAHDLVNAAEADTAKFVRMVMHTNKNAEESLLSPAAWCKVIITFLDFFHKCEAELTLLIRHSVLKDKQTPKCKQSTDGTCQAPCVAVKSALPFKRDKCVYNKRLVDEIKADPGGSWSTRGCALNLYT
jgi:hypothetical protein